MKARSQKNPSSKNSPGSIGKELVLAAILLPLWAFGAFSIYKAEAFSFKLVPELLQIDYSERSALASGPIYGLARNASSIIPKDSTVYFFNPEGSGNGFYVRKLNYFLYPRRVAVVNPGEGLKLDEMEKGGYVIVFVPAEAGEAGSEAALSGFVRMDKVYDYSDDKGRQAIYRVEKEG